MRDDPTPASPTIGPMSRWHEPFLARGLVPTAPIEASVDVGVDGARVWTAISDAGNLERVHPFCATNEVERWPGPDGRDHIHYHSSLHYQRDVLDWREGSGYDLAVGPPSGPIALARWWIEPIDSGTCRFGIEVTSFVRADVDDEQRDRYRRSVIEGGIPPYLDAVVRGVRLYSETGVPVVRNQFGPHPIYSPDRS